MTEDEPWQDPKSPQDARLASLDERLARAQAEEAARSGRAGRAAATGPGPGLARPVGPGQLSARLRADRLCDRPDGRDARDLGGDAVRRLRRRHVGSLEDFEAEPGMTGRGKTEEWRRKAESIRCTSSRFTRSRAIWTEPLRLHQQRLVDADRPRLDLAVHARRDEAPAGARPLAGRGRGRHRLRHLDAGRPASGPRGANIVPWVFTIFMFILFANLLGLMPFASGRRAAVHRHQPVHRSPA